MKCPHCNQEHTDGSRFCPKTGKAIDNQFKACTLNPQCPSFGKYILPKDSVYCPFCGSKLSASPNIVNENAQRLYKKKNSSKSGIISKEEPKYIDMGGSVLWSSCNLGANSPDAIGNYYCWGELETKSEYTEDNYIHKIIKSSLFGLTKKYIFQSLGPNIAGTRYDVATQILGKNYMLPSRKHFEELKNQCSWYRGAFNGIEGWWVKNPQNGNSIFFPAFGYKYGHDIRGYGVMGYYPSADMCTYCLGMHWELLFDFSKVDDENPDGFLFIGDACGLREWGCNIRPVKEK